MNDTQIHRTDNDATTINAGADETQITPWATMDADPTYEDGYGQRIVAFHVTAEHAERVAEFIRSMETPRIIHHRDELENLDPDTLFINRTPTVPGDRTVQAWRAEDAHRFDLPWGGPLVQLTSGDTAREAWKALKQ